MAKGILSETWHRFINANQCTILKGVEGQLIRDTRGKMAHNAKSQFLVQKVYFDTAYFCTF